MISRPTILRAALLRFIPGVLTFLGGGLYVTARNKGIALGPEQIEGFGNLTFFMTLGFLTIVSVMRRALPSAARVAGRRGLLAGFASPAVLLALEIVHGSPASHALNYGFAFLAGSLVTLVMFVPWVLGRASVKVHPLGFDKEPDDDAGALWSHIASVGRAAN